MERLGKSTCQCCSNSSNRAQVHGGRRGIVWVFQVGGSLHSHIVGLCFVDAEERTSTAYIHVSGIEVQVDGLIEIDSDVDW
eukprot:82214-Pelagomonas_calceolata.AAC.3